MEFYLKIEGSIYFELQTFSNRAILMSSESHPDIKEQTF